MGLISAVLFLLFTFISQNLLAALIGSLGLMIAFYYGLTGIACVWFYRNTLFTSARNFVFRGLMPFLGFAMLAVIFVYGLQQYALPDWLTDDAGHNVTIFGIGATAVVGVVGLLAGFVLMFIWWARNPDFFRGRVIPRGAFLEGVAVQDPNRVAD
jgi:hypothetical protein